MALERCVNCRFNLLASVVHCPNCGLLRPTEPLKVSRWVSMKMLGIGLIPIALLSVYIALSIPGFAVAFFIVGTLMWSLPAAAITHTLDTRERRKRLPAVGLTLQRKLELIGERCRELERRSARIIAVLTRIESSESSQLNEVRDKLSKAYENVRGQFALYTVMGADGELTMRQSVLAPLIFQFETFDYNQLEHGLKEVDFAIGRVEFLRDQLAKAEEYSRSPRYRFAEISSRIHETIAGCRKLREAMIGRQALIALQGVGPANIGELGETSEAQQELIETFNVQLEITHFDEIFVELELEYERLMAEEKLDRRQLDDGEIEGTANDQVVS